MSISYSVRQAGKVTVVDLRGRITLNEIADPGTDVLHELIRGLVGQGNKNLLLNLRDVTHVDSSGISELVGCFTTVRSQGGVLKLSNPTEHVQNLLRVTQLFTMFDLMEDESADQSLAKAAA